MKRSKRPGFFSGNKIAITKFIRVKIDKLLQGFLTAVILTERPLLLRTECRLKK